MFIPTTIGMRKLMRKTLISTLMLAVVGLALASKGGVVKDVYFLILSPRKAGAFPTRAQIDRYHEWFKDVPHGVE